jgi:hypothetical protein
MVGCAAWRHTQKQSLRTLKETQAVISNYNMKTPWPESASELYRPSDLRMSAKLVPTFADRWYYVVSLTDPYGRIHGFLAPL